MMTCPRCGTTMEVDSKWKIDDGKPMVIYNCPNCGEMAHK